MTRLHQLHDRYGQSPWLDNLTRGDVTGGRLRRLVDQGIRGVTSNPTIFDKAIAGSSYYVADLRRLVGQGQSVEDIYEALAVADSARRHDDLGDTDVVRLLRRDLPPRVRRVLEHATPLAANPFESVLRAILVEAGIAVVPKGSARSGW